MQYKLQVQNDFFKRFNSINLPEVQSRYIAYKLAELGETEIKEVDVRTECLIVSTTKNTYKVSLLNIDLPINSITKI